MAQGPVIYNALIMPLSSSSAPPRPSPGPKPPGGTTPPPSGGHPDHTLPGDLPRPEHPIYYPLPPDVPPPPYIDNSLPEGQPHPDQGLPGAQPKPEHPIVLPPDSGGWLPIFIWGPNDPRPTPPIELPESPPPTGDGPPIEFKAAWTPTTGWVVIGVPTGDHITPSSKAKK